MAKDSSPLVVSWPAIRKVMHWLRMFSSSSPSPVLWIAALQHPAQQVGVVCRIALLLAFGDDRVDETLHVGLILLELAASPGFRN
jgi:hypothetical protein